MSDLVIVAIITAIPPTLGAVAVLWKMRQDGLQRMRDKTEAIAARELVERKIDSVHELVNEKSDVAVAAQVALKKEIARLLREPGTPTPTIEAGQGEPGEVGIDHGVVTVERPTPFPGPTDKKP